MNEPNPYAAPIIDQQQNPQQHSDRSWVRQIRIVALLMVIQGTLELMFGGYLTAMSFWFPAIMAQQPNQIPAEQQQMVNNIVYFYFGFGGIAAVIIGLLRIIAGILGFMFRGRILGLVSLVLGILILFTIYCMPTAVALCVYGCIVYMNRGVVEAFQMKKNGHRIAAILGHRQA